MINTRELKRKIFKKLTIFFSSIIFKISSRIETFNLIDNRLLSLIKQVLLSFREIQCSVQEKLDENGKKAIREIGNTLD